MGEQVLAGVIDLGELAFSQYCVDMAVAGATDIQNTPQAVVTLKAFANPLEPMRASRDQMVTGRADTASPAQRTAAVGLRRHPG